MPAAGAGTGYNFGEKGLVNSIISQRLFLASAPPAQQTFDTTVSQYGTSDPVVMSIVKNGADAIAGSTVSYTVTFNESVTGVDVSDFSLSTSGSVTGASIASVTGSGASYVVTVNTGSGAGTIGLNLVDQDSIVDTASNPLGGAGADNGSFVGPVYTLTTSVSVTSVTSPINSANDTATTASGTAEAGDTISVVATDGTNSTAAKTTTAASDGSWSVSGVDVSSLADGTITYTATAANAAGTSSQASKTATKDTVAPQVAISSVTNPINAANAGSASASGTGEVGATISLVAGDGTNSTSALTTTVAAGGTWSISAINLSSLADGTITFTVTATDAAGNSADTTQTSMKDTVAPSVTLESVTDPISLDNEHAVQISGTGEVGATISLVANSGTETTAAQTTTVDASGNWSISSLNVSSLADGTITFTATATDAAGNTATASMTASKSTITLMTVTDPVNSANASNTSANGMGEIGATISVTASDGTTSSGPYTTTVGSAGTWSISGIDVSTLADGTITYTATATDTLGNSGHSSKTTTKDTVAPAVALSTVTNPINLSNAASVSASGTGEIGASVSLVASDGTNSVTAQSVTVDANGDWSIEGFDVRSLADGTITFTATASDAAGNTATRTLNSTKDTIAPAVAISSVSNPIKLDNYHAAVASGTGEAGASISLVASDGTNSSGTYTTTVGGDGNWSVSGIDLGSLVDGTITFTVTASDAVGNSASHDRQHEANGHHHRGSQRDQPAERRQRDGQRHRPGGCNARALGQRRHEPVTKLHRDRRRRRHLVNRRDRPHLVERRHDHLHRCSDGCFQQLRPGQPDHDQGYGRAGNRAGSRHQSGQPGQRHQRIG